MIAVAHWAIDAGVVWIAISVPVAIIFAAFMASPPDVKADEDREQQHWVAELARERAEHNAAVMARREALRVTKAQQDERRAVAELRPRTGHVENVVGRRQRRRPA
jgi:hypothetical protein